MTKAANRKREQQRGSVISSVFEWVDSVVLALVIVMLLFTLFINKVEVKGTSMESTLSEGDQLIITDFNYKPKQGDIIIISRNYLNTEVSAAESKTPIVKRVIATEGQTVEIKDGKVYVNDKEIEEPYLDKALVANGTENKGFYDKEIVPEDCVFVLGDNRGVSHDSRSSDIRFVNERYVLGKVLFRIFPFDSIITFG
ncbi:MAG: signal peptidase I [Acutalibacteraceae bacterium]|nr:signal peptidase I [Acutalibacteraceae bacterium]